MIYAFQRSVQSQTSMTGQPHCLSPSWTLRRCQAKPSSYSRPGSYCSIKKQPTDFWPATHKMSHHWRLPSNYSVSSN